MLMATDTEISHTFTVLEGSYNNKDNTPTSNNELQVKSEPSGKPPRHLSTVRHSISSAMLVASADLDFDYGVKEAQCPSKGKPSFIPVYRSGSYAEKGPKQYMEDEHIRIDHLLEHFGSLLLELSMGFLMAMVVQMQHYLSGIIFSSLLLRNLVFPFV